MHPALPQTMTPENLATWITDNSVDSFTDKRPQQLSEFDIADYEHRSAEISIELDKLKEVKKEFDEYLKTGTPEDSIGEHQPVNISIPATTGIKALTERREEIGKILIDGQIEESTQLYTIPYPEGKKMVVVDIEGNEFEHLTKDMSQEQLEKLGNLFVSDGLKEDEEEIKVTPMTFQEGGSDGVELKPKKKKKDVEPFI